MVTAVGGTAGPPTGHMVIAARSKSIHGPWENCPHNPLVRTTDAREKWWSRGHATLVEGPEGDWWSVYHGYENSYWTLGRQTLLDRISWTDDGWFRFEGKDLSTAIPKPVKLANQTHGIALSDDFSKDKFGIQWAFYSPGDNERARVAYEDGALVLTGKGDSPSNCSPITCITGDQAYRCEVEIEVEGAATGGVLFFYNKRMYAGLGFNDRQLVRHRTALDAPRAKPKDIERRLFIRFENNRHIVTFHTSPDGVTLDQVRAADGNLGLPPQHRLRLPERAAGPLRRGRRQGPVPQLQVPGDLNGVMAPFSRKRGLTPGWRQPIASSVS